MKWLLLVFILKAFLFFSPKSEFFNRADNVLVNNIQKNNFIIRNEKTAITFYDTSALQRDINAFWENTRKELATVPIEAKVATVQEALPYRKFTITVRSLNNVTVAAFLSLPVQGEGIAKPWPVIVTVPGYGGDQQGVMLSECQRGYSILQVFPRGEGESAKYFTLDGDKLTSKLDNPEGAYYQGAYADVMRMIDYIVTRPDIDSSRIAMVGTSQGGGISLAVTALDTRIKAVVAQVPFLCDFRLAASLPTSLVKKLLNKADANKEASFRTLDYFDPFQLASGIHVSVLISAGGKDETCPMQTIQSVYERINGKKQLKIYPDLGHSSCVDFYNQSWIWLDKNFRQRSRIDKKVKRKIKKKRKL
jgi:cephalosporin-C deacetylase